MRESRIGVLVVWMLGDEGARLGRSMNEMGFDD